VDNSSIKKISPLDGLISPTGTITLAEKQFVGKINIRGNVNDQSFASTAEKVLGTALPTTPNTTSPTQEGTVFWLGPDEWLVHTPSGTEAGLIGDLRSAFSGLHAAVTDVSDYYVMIELRGQDTNNARDVLARACPLDLHKRTFITGQCAQSYFANASILLHQVGEDAYDIQVRWTYADYLWRYLSQSINQMAA
jgi:sarcosine oxidase subunit gamma